MNSWAEEVVDILHVEDAEKERRSYRVRPSSLPLCHKAHVYEQIHPKHVSDVIPLPYYREFGARIGDVIHEMVQRRFGNRGILFGHWRCRSCWELTTYHLGCPMYCSSCLIGMPTEFEYVELTLAHPLIPSGHIDGLIPLKWRDILAGKLDAPSAEDWREYEWVLLEIKNCPTPQAINEKWNLKVAWLHQNAAYLRMLMDIEKLHIEAVMFFKQGRINSRAGQTVMIPVSKIRPYFTQETEQHIEASLKQVDALTDRPVDIRKVKGICQKKGDEKWCRWTEFCFSKNVHKEVARMQARKPRRLSFNQLCDVAD